VTPRSAGTGPAGPTPVYRFEDADASQPGLFRGKGAGLARMTDPYEQLERNTAPPPAPARPHRLRRPASIIDPWGEIT
jgi:hypothetical protein